MPIISTERKVFRGSVYGIIAIIVPIIYYFIEIYYNKKFIDVKTFASEHSFELGIWAIIVTVVGAILSMFYPDYEKLFLTSGQKDKIRLLRKFAPQFQSFGLVGNNSIYNSIVKLLGRAANRALAKEEIELKLLLCSPALDYPGRIDFMAQNQFWGNEVYDKIKDILGQHLYSKVTITYLPDETISGFNPLKGFIETLSNYISQKGKYGSANDIYQKLLYSNNRIVTMFQNQKFDLQDRLTLNESIMVDIPFQIVMYKTKDFQEVIVSFASKEILEDINGIEPKGFHSVDLDVVEIFEEIYNSYVCEHRRMPIKPSHTLSIIEKQKRLGKHHINNYLKSELNSNLMISVDDGVFSPKLANSSKFTSYVITKILKGQESVLDIGSGTGVQALVAYEKLKELNIVQPNVWALETVESAFNNLKNNVDTKQIKTKRWGLFSIVSNNTPNNVIKFCDEVDETYEKLVGGILGEFDSETKKYKEIPYESLKDFGPFDLVIADLPYVDTQPSNPSELAYFDYNHLTHRTLFKIFKTSQWVKNNTMLVTSFSTLGGLEDLAKFERLIISEELTSIQWFSFYEDNYLWLVYCLVNSKKVDVKNYWRERFLS